MSGLLNINDRLMESIDSPAPMDVGMETPGATGLSTNPQAEISPQALEPDKSDSDGDPLPAGYEEEYFSVDKIVDKRINNGEIEYYVQWVGYSPDDNTWEPITNLDCPTLLEAYEASLVNQNSVNNINIDSLVKDNTNIPLEDNIDTIIENNIDFTLQNNIDILLQGNNDDVPFKENMDITSLQENIDVTTPLQDKVNVIPFVVGPSKHDSDKGNDVIMVDITQEDENQKEDNIIKVAGSVTNTDTSQIPKINAEPSSSGNQSSIPDNDDLVSYDIPNQYEPENIVGATDLHGELMFLIKWQNKEQANLVPSRIANIRWPQAVIQFYEDRLQFSNDGVF